LCDFSAAQRDDEASSSGRGSTDDSSKFLGPGLKQHWQGRACLIGEGEEGAGREKVLDELEDARLKKAQRKADEMAMMAAKNDARCVLHPYTHTDLLYA
jgi:hypothetical protein